MKKITESAFWKKPAGPSVRWILAILITITIFKLVGMAATSKGIYPDTPEAQSYMESLRILQSEDLIKAIRAEKGKPTIFVVHASWCSSCRVMLPRVLNMLNNTETATGRIFVSIDTNYNRFARYMVGRGYKDAFIPYILQDTPTALNFVQELKLHFDGRIPYIALFNPDGTLAAEAYGDVGWNALEQKFKTLVH